MRNTLNAIDFRFFIGCPCYITYPDKLAISTIQGVDSSLNVVISEWVNYAPGLVKPILRKFESLSRQEVEELNKLWPKENIQRTTFGSIQLDANIINYLTSLHVDVFGWIEQGLAVDAEYNSTSLSNKKEKEKSRDEKYDESHARCCFMDKIGRSSVVSDTLKISLVNGEYKCSAVVKETVNFQEIESFRKKYVGRR